MPKSIELIYACDVNGAIGYQGSLPWFSIHEDMQWFREHTSRKCIVMGRSTWESIGSEPLKNRINVVVTSKTFEPQPGVHFVTFAELWPLLDTISESIVCIGGAQLYDAMLPYATTIYRTIVGEVYKADTFFCPDLTQYDCRQIKESHYGNNSLRFFICKKRHEEEQYLTLLRRAISSKPRIGRNGAVRALFGGQMRFSLLDGRIPVLTTKKVFWKGVVEELIWMIRGSTNAQELADKGVNIWMPNATPEYLATRGLTYTNGELGPVYGKQWRRWSDGCGNEYDQLSFIIDAIKQDPHSRRLVMNAWNVADLDKMALPPCHVMCQFFVEDGYIDCHMYQRSADVGLGMPFNIASYSLLTHIMARICGLEARSFVYSYGDAHVYENHHDALLTQLEREPREFPTLEMADHITDLESVELSSSVDYKLVGYNPHQTINMTMTA